MGNNHSSKEAQITRPRKIGNNTLATLAAAQPLPKVHDQIVNGTKAQPSPGAHANTLHHGQAWPN